MMNSWITWLVVAGIVVILELFTGTFYLLMIALGLAAGALVAAVGASVTVTLLIAAVVGAIATLALHKSKYGYRKGQEAARDPNVNMDIGQKVHVADWQDQGNGVHTARVHYRGTQWDVELRHSAPYAGTFVIEEVQGSRFIVKPV